MVYKNLFKIYDTNIKTLHDFFTLCLFNTLQFFSCTFLVALVFYKLNIYKSMFFLSIIMVLVTVGIDILISNALHTGNIKKLYKFCMINSGFIGSIFSIFFNFYGLKAVLNISVLSIIMFGITLGYGYLSNNDMSNLSNFIKILCISCVGLSFVGFLGMFLNPQMGIFLFGIQTLISFVINIVLFIWLSSEIKRMYHVHMSNQHSLQLYGMYVGYSFARNLVSLIKNLLYLCYRGGNNNDRG